MVMQPNHHHHQPWKLTIHTEAKNFHLKLKANKLFSFPSSKLFQFSIRFKLRHFLVDVKSEPHYSFPQRLKSRSLQLLSKLRIRRANKAVSAGKSVGIIRVPTRFAYKLPAGVSSEVARNFALLCRSISEKDLHGIFKSGSMMLLYLVSQVYGCLSRTKCTMMLLLLVAILVSPMVLLRKFFPVSNYFFKAKIVLHLLEFIASLK